MKKNVSALLFFSIILMLALLVTPVFADEYYYTWDSANYYTEIYAPAGQVGSDAKAYADITGLIKLFAKGGIGFYGQARAWGHLSRTVPGQGRWIKPSITVEVKGLIINGGVATITLYVIDVSTGTIIGEWTWYLPISFPDPLTETFVGDAFNAKSDRSYTYLVKAYVAAPITLMGGHVVDYWDQDYIKVKPLHIEYIVYGGCPYVSTWDGNRYVLDNNILPSSELSNGADVEDYYKLEQTLVPRYGKYSLLISEFEQERSYIDQVKLLAVDHEPDVSIAVTPNGEILTYKNSAAPISAVDNNGNDRLNEIRLMDGNVSDPSTYFYGTSGDYLIVDFGQVNSDNAKLILRTDWIKEKECILVQVKNSSGTWQTVETIIPRNYWSIEGVNLSPYIVHGQDFTVKLYWKYHHRLDYVGLDTTKQDDYQIRYANMVLAIHSTRGNVKEFLSENDNLYAELAPGQQIQLAFTLSHNSQEARTYLFYTKGRYYTITP